MNREEEIKKLRKEIKSLKGMLYFCVGCILAVLVFNAVFDYVSTTKKIELETKAAECNAKNMCIEQVDGEYECVDCKTLGIE